MKKVGGVSHALTRRKARKTRTTRKPGALNYTAKQRVKNIVAYMTAKKEHLSPPSHKGLDDTFINLVREFAESQPEQEEHEDFTRAMRHLKRAIDRKDIHKIIYSLNKISEMYGYTKYELAHFYIEDAREKAGKYNASMNELTAAMKNIGMQ